MNAPNALALARALAALPIAFLVITPGPANALVALGLFAIAAATDAIDGRLARWRGEVTPLGALLDPIADKVLVLGTLAAVSVRGSLPLWALAAIGGRELAVTALRAVGATPTTARGWGKVKVAVQDTGATALLAALAFPVLRDAAEALLALAVAVTLASLAEHLPMRPQLRAG